MEMVHWEPTREVMALHTLVERLLREPHIFPTRQLFPRAWEDGLLIDMMDTEDAVVVKAAMPGVKPDHIEVTVTGDTLSIRGEAKSDEKVDEEDYIYREMRYGVVSRQISLPSWVEPDKAAARFENGVLTITVPKAEEAKNHTIRVEVKS